MEKDEALRKAKLDFLADPGRRMVAHPYFWAPFVLVGNDKPVTDNKEWESSIFYILVAVSVLTGLFWLARKKIRSSV